MAQLIIDIGNTRIKSALFEGRELLAEFSSEDLDLVLASWEKVDFRHCLVSSVRWSRPELETKLPFNFLFLDSKTSLPVKNFYKSIHSLGLDRVAGAIGAWVLSERKAVLAVDLGTCITFDFINARSEYIGGAISPGLSLRAKSMHSLTANLPLISLKSAPEYFTGATTEECMKAGIWYGINFEIEGQIKKYIQENPELEVFICGGDAQCFESLAKDHIFVVPNLVLVGLNCILNHNVE